jgi:cold shock CspA family protein
MPRGRVKFFDHAKDFGGFVIPDAGPDIYLWSEAVREAKLKNLKSLDRVEYEVGRHPITGRPCVVKIAVIEEDWQEAPSWFREKAIEED